MSIKVAKKQMPDFDESFPFGTEINYRLKVTEIRMPYGGV